MNANSSRNFLVRTGGIVKGRQFSEAEVRTMLIRRELWERDEVLEQGSDEWIPILHTDLMPTGPKSHELRQNTQYAVESSSGNISERLVKAAMIFGILGGVFGILGVLAFGTVGVFCAGGMWTLALIVYVFAHVMR